LIIINLKYHNRWKNWNYKSIIKYC